MCNDDDVDGIDDKEGTSAATELDDTIGATKNIDEYNGDDDDDDVLLNANNYSSNINECTDSIEKNKRFIGQKYFTFDQFTSVVKAQYIYYDNTSLYKQISTVICPTTSCIKNPMQIMNVTTNGVAVEIKLLCELCQHTKIVQTCPEKVIGANTPAINKLIPLAVINAGISYMQLNKYSANVGLQVMPESSFHSQ